MSARIYSPAKNAMQSGRGNTGNWLLVFNREVPGKIEPLMGYSSSSDMNAQVKMEFPTLEAAQAYAEKQGIAYSVSAAKPDKRRRAMAYADNFSYNRIAPWTH